MRKLANSILFELHDAILPLPGSTMARELLLRRAQEYLDSLADEAKGDAALQRERALAYQRIGDVLGSTWQANFGKTSLAIENQKKSLGDLQRPGGRGSHQPGIAARPGDQLPARLQPGADERTISRRAGGLPQGPGIARGHRQAASGQFDRAVRTGLLLPGHGEPAVSAGRFQRLGTVSRQSAGDLTRSCTRPIPTIAISTSSWRWRRCAWPTCRSS